MDGEKAGLRFATRSLGERMRSLLCRVGTLAELVIAAGGDRPVGPGVVPMCGLRTGLAIVGWWVVGVLVGQLFEELRGLSVWPVGRGDCRVVSWSHIPWWRVVLLVLSIAGVVAFRFWMPLPCIVQIHN